MHHQQLIRLFRAEHGRILAAMLRFTHDIDLIEDALQDAYLQALQQWPSSGVPDNLGAWLMTVTRRRMIDRIRRQVHHRDSTNRQHVIDSLQRDTDMQLSEHSLQDDQLKLIFTCCHPALSRHAQIALTLKIIGGLTVREIARAFLTSETTILQRITRAKRKIKTSAIPYEIPADNKLQQRLASVLDVIYLIYNESHTAFEGQTLSREELANEALRLASLTYELLPEPEVAGLFALILFHEARRPARLNETQELIPLAHQNRELWDQDKIDRGHQLLTGALQQGKLGPFQLQAAISGIHAQSLSWQHTDWPQIYALYQRLSMLQPSPVIELNKFVALAYLGNPNQALERITYLHNELKDYQPYYAALAEVYRQLNNTQQALNAYKKAIELSKNQAEKYYLSQQKATLQCGSHHE